MSHGSDLASCTVGAWATTATFDDEPSSVVRTAAHSSITPDRRVYSRASASGTDDSAIDSTAIRAMCGAAQRRNSSEVARKRPTNSRAHVAARGTLSSAAMLVACSLLASRPSSVASARSAVSTETAITFCRSAGAIGNAAVAQRSAMRASARGSVVVSPTTDGISSVSCERP